jgi:hypothetical protein
MWEIGDEENLLYNIVTWPSMANGQRDWSWSKWYIFIKSSQINKFQMETFLLKYEHEPDATIDNKYTKVTSGSDTVSWTIDYWS